jgi:hypothetical protein
MKHLLIGLFGWALLSGLWQPGFAQQAGVAPSAPKPAAQKEAGATGSLSGRVIDEDDQPQADVEVRLNALGRSGVSSRQVITDEEGNFRFSDLPDGDYLLYAQTPGYVETPGANRSYRPGQTVTLKLRKGGAITGRVTNAQGEPVVAVGVSARQLRNTSGAANSAEIAGNYIYTQPTDDRGIYRLYGLPPGSYLIVANAPAPSITGTLAYEKELPAYHPAGPRDAAQPIEVRFGAEVSGIDIRYAAERGHLITGTVTGGPAASSANSSYATVSLRRVASGEEVANTPAQPNATGRGFTFSSIPDGDYELIARLTSSATSGATSAPRRVSVKGADVTGVTLALLPLGSLAGRVVLEAPTAALSCVPSKLPALEESSLLLRRIGQPPAGSAVADTPFLAGRPNTQGEFVVGGVTAGVYYPSYNVREGNFWYLRTFTAQPAAGHVIDLARTGISFKTGEELAGVTFYLTPGAALLQGRLTSAEGQPLPELLRVHLIPAEPNAADEILRYAEMLVSTAVNKEARFGFNRVAPGRYRLLTETVARNEPAERRAVLAAWNPAERAKLRRLAAAQPELELKACEFVERYEVRLK